MKGYSVFDRKKVIAIILAALIAIASIITLYATVLPAGTDSSESAAREAADRSIEKLSLIS